MMIDFNNLSLLDSWVLDVILILISASACFYCALLSRRLKALNRLDSGVGASIVSLTEAIGKTHDAAREAQSSTVETVKTLRFLLEKSESMAPALEASMTEASRSLASVKKLKLELDTTVKEELKEGTVRAKTMAANLLKTVEALEARYIAREKELAKGIPVQNNDADEVESNIKELPLLRKSVPKTNISLAAKQEKDTELKVAI